MIMEFFHSNVLSCGRLLLFLTLDVFVDSQIWPKLI